MPSGIILPLIINLVHTLKNKEHALRDNSLIHEGIICLCYHKGHVDVVQLYQWLLQQVLGWGQGSGQSSSQGGDCSSDACCRWDLHIAMSSALTCTSQQDAFHHHYITSTRKKWAMPALWRLQSGWWRRGWLRVNQQESRCRRNEEKTIVCNSRMRKGASKEAICDKQLTRPPA